MRRRVQRVTAPMVDVGDGKQLVTKIDALLGGGSRMSHAFAMMAIAEEEIAAHDAERPGLFLLLQCPPGMSGVSEKVYRAHARELLLRVLAGEDTRPGTKAEVLMHCSAASLKRPPGNEELVLFERCFEHVFGLTVPGYPAREAYPGQFDDLLEQCRKAYRDEKRVLR